MNDKNSPAPRANRSLYRISIRMTTDERKIIGRKAFLANLSVSRFLVEAACSEAALLPQDRTRLRWLLALFHRTGERLRSLSLLPLLSQAGPEARQELLSVLRLIEALEEEMRKRLG